MERLHTCMRQQAEPESHDIYTGSPVPDQMTLKNQSDGRTVLREAPFSSVLEAPPSHLFENLTCYTMTTRFLRRDDNFVTNYWMFGLVSFWYRRAVLWSAEGSHLVPWACGLSFARCRQRVLLYVECNARKTEVFSVLKSEYEKLCLWVVASIR